MQMGFVHESKYCTGCKACQVACKDKHDSEVGENFRRVTTVEGGGYAEQNGAYRNNVFAYSISIACNHCADPKCVKNCPSGAMRKDPETGIVLIDPEVCIGCGYCAWSCPYGAPQMQKKKGVMGKCDFCRDLLVEGKEPVCVAACPLHLLHCGDLEELKRTYGGQGAPKVMPDEKITHPSLIVVPHRDSL